MAFLRSAVKGSANLQRSLSNTSRGSNFPHVRIISPLVVHPSASKSTHAATVFDSVSSEDKQRPDELDLSFENAEAAFKSKTTWEIFRAYMVFTLCSSEYLVENNMKLMRLGRKVFGTRLFEVMMKSTFYGQFVGGEDQIRIRPTIERLHSFGVKSILDYSVEEDITAEEAEKREVASCVSAAGDESTEGTIKRYHTHKQFADRRYKVQSARTYFYLNEAQCEKNMEIFMRCLEAVSGVTKSTGLAAIKMTALGRPQVLLQLSEVIMRTRRYFGDVTGREGAIIAQRVRPEELKKKFEQQGVLEEQPVKQFLDKVTYDNSGLINLFDWSGIIDENAELSETFRVPDLKSGRMVRLITQLTSREEEMFRNMIRRLNKIFKTAQELDARVMVDAEQTYFQPAISRITVEMMQKYNREKAYVFNTYQCYLKEAYNNVVLDLEQSSRQNFYFGAKLVRGAYMDQERARAAALGYEDPINANYEATSQMYEKTLTECLRRIKELKDSGEEAKKIAVMVASHNEDTIRFTIQKMKELEISPEDKVVCFGQLLGMCDQISFPLGQSGYSVYKYLPYGPVQEVLPYLSRRATENRGLLKKIKKEKRLLRNELARRIFRGQIFYKPKGKYTPV